MMAAVANKRRIWEAAYAAAFVAALHEGLSQVDALGRRTPFDVALANNAEEAIIVADAAVAQLDDWLETETP